MGKKKKEKKEACRGSIFYGFKEEGKFAARFIQMRDRQGVEAWRGKQEPRGVSGGLLLQCF